MRFVQEMYRMQLRDGRVFLHEHRARAKSWTLREVQRMSAEEQVDVVEADQYMYGLKTRGEPRTALVPAKQTEQTRWTITNSLFDDGPHNDANAEPTPWIKL